MSFRRRMMMAANSKSYDAEIEYLESNMTDIQYIDLGLKGTPNVVVELKFSTTALSDVGQPIFGSRYSWGTNTQGSAFILFIGRGDTKYTFQYGHNGDVNQVSSVQYNSQTWHTATLRQNARIDSWTYNNVNYRFTTPQNLTMFGSNFSGGAVNRGSNTRIAYCKVYVGGTLTLDLIPVRKNGIGYMYDKVSGKLFGNSGSGNFILGDDVN